MLTLVQMHGDPGSGKSAIARGLALGSELVHIDKDVILSSLLEGGAGEELARPLAHEVMWALANDVLAQGKSVVVDTPAWRPPTVERGQAIARHHAAQYVMIECVCSTDEIDERLASRVRLRSHPETRRNWYVEWNLERPSVDRLRLNTSQPLDSAIREAREYVNSQSAEVNP